MRISLILVRSVLFCPCVPRVVAHSRSYPSTRFGHSGAPFRLFVCGAGPWEIPPAVGRCWLSTGSTAAACAVPLSPCGSHVPARPAEGVVVVRATAIPNARRAADHAASQAARSDADAICRARQEHLSVAHVRHEGANSRRGARSFISS